MSLHAAGWRRILHMGVLPGLAGLLAMPAFAQERPAAKPRPPVATRKSPAPRAQPARPPRVLAEPPRLPAEPNWAQRARLEAACARWRLVWGDGSECLPGDGGSGNAVDPLRDVRRLGVPNSSRR